MGGGVSRWSQGGISGVGWWSQPPLPPPPGGLQFLKRIPTLGPGRRRNIASWVSTACWLHSIGRGRGKSINGMHQCFWISMQLHQYNCKLHQCNCINAFNGIALGESIVSGFNTIALIQLHQYNCINTMTLATPTQLHRYNCIDAIALAASIQLHQYNCINTIASTSHQYNDC